MKLWSFGIFLCVILVEAFVEDPILRSLKCPKPTFVNGKVRVMKRGRSARFKCNPSFQLVGEMYGTCLRGRWDKIPICVRPGCIPVTSFGKGHVDSDRYNGALVTFMCNPGYSMVGNSQIYCDGSFWNGSIPQCTAVGKTDTLCNFETSDICGWNQDPFHTFNWSRKNYQAPRRNLNTGPAYDHTLGPGKGGYYMYIDSSGTRLENDTARLFSPVYSVQLTRYQPACFTFWYHMFGTTIGTLNVYFKPETVAFDSLLEANFTASGDHSDVWHQGYILLPRISENFQVIIEAIRGPGIFSDIAIDDVKVANGNECLDIMTEFAAAEATSQSNVTIAVGGTVKTTLPKPLTYPTPPPLPPLPPRPEIPQNTTSSMPQLEYTTDLSRDDIQPQSELSTAAKRIPIPTEPTPLVLKPVTSLIAKKGDRVLNTTTASTTSPFWSTSFPVVAKETIATTTTTPRPIPTTTTSTTTVKKLIIIKPIPVTNSTTTSTTTLPTKKTTLPLRTTTTTAKTTTTTAKTTTTTTTTTTTLPTTSVRSVFIPPPRGFLTTLPRITLATTESVPETEVPLLAIPNPKYSRDRKWIEARRGPIKRKTALLSTTSIVVISTLLVIATTAGILMYLYIRRRRRTRRQNCIADDSDVRFLTADEALDFSLARPMDSEEDL